MTVNEWLAARRPEPPSALALKVTSALGAEGNESGADVANVCLAAGEKLVADLLARDCTHRESASDLLAADALVTYAFEAAGQEPATLVSRAEGAMRRIATMAREGAA